MATPFCVVFISCSYFLRSSSFWQIQTNTESLKMVPKMGLPFIAMMNVWLIQTDTHNGDLYLSTLSICARKDFCAYECSNLYLWVTIIGYLFLFLQDIWNPKPSHGSLCWKTYNPDFIFHKFRLPHYFWSVKPSNLLTQAEITFRYFLVASSKITDTRTEIKHELS